MTEFYIAKNDAAPGEKVLFKIEYMGIFLGIAADQIFAGQAVSPYIKDGIQMVKKAVAPGPSTAINKITAAILKQAMGDTAHHQNQVQGFLYPDKEPDFQMHLVRDLTLAPGTQTIYGRRALRTDYDLEHGRSIEAQRMCQLGILADQINKLMETPETEVGDPEHDWVHPFGMEQ